MRRGLLCLVLATVLGCGSTQQPVPAQSSPASDRDFAGFLREWEAGQASFVNGDPTQWISNSSHTPDASIFGAFGGYEKTWTEVGPRYEWAAAQHQKSGATKSIEYLSTITSGDLAATVAIERDRVLTAGSTASVERGLRVTQIFRWEDGGWKLVHRHADPLLEKKAPAAVTK